MGKLAPEELWRRHTIERFIAFKQSGELERLRTKGLTICGRKKRFTGKEWFDGFTKRYSSPEYRKWHQECEAVGQRFGLAPWTVVCACLVSGYDPKKLPFPVEIQWPEIRVITESTDAQFVTRLAYEAQSLGLHVIERHGSVETAVLFANPVPLACLEPPPLVSRPPRHSAFRVRVETPIGYPPEAARKLQTKAEQLMKELAKRLGYSIFRRLRSSKLVSKADELRVGEKRLPNRALYEIVAETYKWRDASRDEQRRKTVKTRRHRLRKRLVDEYEADD